MLLAGAALLIQSLWNLQRVDPGFRTERLLTMQVWLPERKYPTPSGVRTFSDEMLRRVEALPGVRSASTVNTRPFLGWFLGLDVEVPGYVPPETIEGGDLLTYRVVSNLYFETLGAELVQGRGFLDRGWARRRGGGGRQRGGGGPGTGQTSSPSAGSFAPGSSRARPPGSPRGEAIGSR